MLLARWDVAVCTVRADHKTLAHRPDGGRCLFAPRAPTRLTGAAQ